MNFRLALLLPALTAFAGAFPFASLMAEDSPGGGSGAADAAFRRADRDGDGKVTRTELPQTELFQRFDQNADGHITLEETRAAFGKTAGASGALSELRGLKGSVETLFQRADKNGDGQLDAAEVPRPGLFRLLDRDGNATVTLEEAREALTLARNQKGDDIPTPTEPPQPVRTSSPTIEKPGDVGIGRQVPEVTVRTFDGVSRSLGELSGKNGLVIALTSTTCPVSLRYVPSLTRLQGELAADGIGFLWVNAFASETEETVGAFLQEKGLAPATYLRDADKSLTSVLGARTTTEVFLLDPARTLIYRGAIDDQYGIDYSLDAPKNTYLRDAIAAWRAGNRPEIAATHPPGCEIDLSTGSGDTKPTDLTWHRDISRILQQNCVDCHHEDGIAPFALDDLAEVEDRARVIRRVIEEGTMPPWSAAPPADGKESPWANDRSLSDRDKADLLAWLSAKERPVGDPTDAPVPRHFAADGWLHGEPDAVFAFDKPIPIKAEGKMPYVNVTMPTGLTEDKWIRGFEILPGAREVVHHIIVFAVDPANPGERFSEIGGYFALYVPGTSAQMFPAGFAKRLPAGATLRFQMHYTPNGSATEDLTRIGFHYTDRAPQYEVKVTSVPNTRISIPAGAENHEETATRPAPFDMTVMGFLPHLHLRGKAFRYEVIGPDGVPRQLLDVPRYDFNWQLYYRLKEPLFLPRGTRVRATAWYDNSVTNPANPDPTRTVRWGPQSEDEMMIGYIEYFVPVDSAPVAGTAP
ncbi:MAG: EF-hand domain-containing protein [Verrucomicrobiales bacterium]|nr:EF-hand domain-containing protein [Verrucomicrobiales bacterium]